MSLILVKIEIVTIKLLNFKLIQNNCYHILLLLGIAGQLYVRKWNLNITYSMGLNIIVDIINDYFHGYLYCFVLLTLLSWPGCGCNSTRKPWFSSAIRSSCYQILCWSTITISDFGPRGSENLIVWTGVKSIHTVFFLSDRAGWLHCYVKPWNDSIYVGNCLKLAQDHPFLGKEMGSKNEKSVSSFLIAPWLLGNILAFWRE